jgi:hypothetical protein
MRWWDLLCVCTHVHQRDDIGGQRSLVAVSKRVGRQNTRRSVAAQVRHDRSATS